MSQDAVKIGHFVVIEGNDCTGKTVLIAKLTALLEGLGHEVVQIREPGGTIRGEQYRALLKGERASRMTPFEEVALLAANREDLYANVVAPALAAGKIVIGDRGYFSTYALQIHPHSEEQPMLLQAFNFITGLNVQHLNGNPIFQVALTLEEAIRQERLAKRPPVAHDDFESRGPEYQGKVVEAYHILTQQPGVLNFDSNIDPDLLASNVLGELMIAFEQREHEVEMMLEKAKETGNIDGVESDEQALADAGAEQPAVVVPLSKLKEMMLEAITMHSDHLLTLFKGDVGEIEADWAATLGELRAWVNLHIAELAQREEPMYEQEAEGRTQQIGNNIGQILGSHLTLLNIRQLNATAAQAPVAPAVEPAAAASAE